jgi:ribosome-binding protein aMBF1 (putative translation factor)
MQAKCMQNAGEMHAECRGIHGKKVQRMAEARKKAGRPAKGPARARARRYMAPELAVWESRLRTAWDRFMGVFVKVENARIVRRERLRRGMNLPRLAAALGVSKQAVSEFEQGVRALGPEHRLRLESVLGVRLCPGGPLPGDDPDKALD